jgi:hypothetical protein
MDMEKAGQSPASGCSQINTSDSMALKPAAPFAT